MSAERNDKVVTNVAQQTTETAQPTAPPIAASQTASPVASNVTTPPPADAQVANTVSDGTGEYDARFLLWRQFCEAHNVSVDLLPSELDGDLGEKWNKAKDEVLHQPAENTETPAQTTKS